MGPLIFGAPKFHEVTKFSADEQMLNAIAHPADSTTAKAAAERFRVEHKWDGCSEKSKYALRQSLYQQGKSLGHDKASMQTLLSALLPVDQAVVQRKAEQKQALKDLHATLQSLEAAEQLALNSSTVAKTEIARAKDASLAEIDGVRKLLQADFDELARQRQLLQLEQAAFLLKNATELR